MADLHEHDAFGARRISRRDLMKGALAGGALAGLALTGCGGSSNNNGQAAKPAATAAGGSASSSGAAATAPAAAVNIKGQKLSILSGTYFVAAAQDLFAKQVKDWGTQTGVDASVDFINWPDIQAKISAGIQSGSGPDIIQTFQYWTALYADNLVDVTSLVEPLGKAGGGFFDWAPTIGQVKGKWLHVPQGTSPGVQNYRISYLKTAGYDKFPDTWDEYFAMARKLKAMGKPVGQALGHSLGDPASLVYPLLWSYGAMEVDKDGKTVRINSKETNDIVSRFVQEWKAGFDETGLSWDDSSNNRAFLSDQIAVTQNGASIYIAGLKSNPDIAKDMNHALNPQGPQGRYHTQGANGFSIMSYSKSKDAAKEFLKWWFTDEQFGAFFKAQAGYWTPAVKKWNDDPIWTSDPKLTILREASKYGRFPGWQAPPGDGPAQTLSKYIIVDMFAQAVSSGNVKGAIQNAETQMKQIYSS